MGIDTMATNLGVSAEEAKPILGSFHEEMPFLKDIYNLTANEAEQEGFIRTISGRKRRFNRVDVGGTIYQSTATAEADGRDLSRERWSRLYTYRALNAKLQGSNADLMKKALVQCYDDGLFKVLVPHLTVHDEMNSSVPKTNEGREAFAEMKNIMQNAAKLVVPIYADAGTGDNWNEAKG
jgi:DNA polymerase-1